MQILWLAVTFAKEHDLQVSAIDTALQDVRTFTVNKGSLTKVRIFWLSILSTINWVNLFHNPLPADLPTTYKTHKLVKPLPKGMHDLFGKFIGDCFPRFPHRWVVHRSDRWWSSWWCCLHRKNLGTCSFLLDFSNAQFLNFPDLTDCFPDTPKRAGSIPHLLVDSVPFFGDNLSVGFFGVKSDNRNPGDVNKVNVSLLFFFIIIK